MKSLFRYLGLSLLLGSLCLSASAHRPEKFTITGNIAGLMPGDTLVFEWSDMYNEGNEPFTVVVEEQGRFFYKGTLSHTQSYQMIYKPASGEEVVSEKSGLSIVITKGKYSIEGTADDIYYSIISGGVYDDPYLRRFLLAENEYGKKQNAYMREFEAARESGDTARAEKLSWKCDNFKEDHADEYKVLSQLEEEFSEHSPSSEYYIYSLTWETSHTPLEELQSIWGRLDLRARETYYGQIFKRQMDRRAQLLPGCDAPDFELVAMDGNRISSKDLKGSYVLIYRWGPCMGSILVDPEVIDFYNKYKDRVKIVGLTGYAADIREIQELMGPGSSIVGYDIDLYAVLGNMLAHPWPDAENKSESNEAIEATFCMGGLPYFVSISPEGKMIGRGFHSVFYDMRKMIEKEFGK